jgi:hypothetical protein
MHAKYLSGIGLILNRRMGLSIDIKLNPIDRYYLYKTVESFKPEVTLNNIPFLIFNTMLE